MIEEDRNEVINAELADIAKLMFLLDKELGNDAMSYTVVEGKFW